MIIELILSGSLSIGAAERGEAMSPDDAYLCGVYERLIVRQDGAGDFSWKDGVAAARVGMSVCRYAIEGMAPRLRQALAALGREADSREIPWSILAGFRDDYRQSIASGFKAGNCNSLHGGSCRTKGHGDGRAADLGVTVGDPDELFRLIDTFGAGLGLYRPMKDSDPAHVQIDLEPPPQVVAQRLEPLHQIVRQVIVRRAKADAVEDDDKPVKKRRAERDDDDYEPTVKRRRVERDDDDDEPKAKRRSQRDDDDDDAKPRKRSRRVTSRDDD